MASSKQVPLSEARLKQLQAEAKAEGVAYHAAIMSSWSEEQARYYFATGGRLPKDLPRSPVPPRRSVPMVD